MDYLQLYLKNEYTRDKEVISTFFQKYDQNGEGFLSSEQFRCFVEENFDCSDTNAKSRSDSILRIFQLIDIKKDGKLDEQEWEMAWYYWLKQILSPVTALLIIDVQNDFINGSLALSNCPAGQDGFGVVPIINSIQGHISFDVVAYSKDWHPPNHISFIDNINSRPLHSSSKVSASEATVTDTVVFAGPPVTEQVMWPRHCVQDSRGADFHPDLMVLDKSYVVNKGTHPDVDSYSAFWDNNKLSQTKLVNILAKHKVTDVYVCGLAYDVCVGSTALHALEHGFRTVLIEDGCRGVCLQGIDDMRQKLISNGAYIGTSDEVQDLVSAKKRPLLLAVKAAENYAMARRIVQSKEV
ncbi:nicotinamidase-like [Haliotis rufescens]|uniref:nicotinamidase-like n=1 Tax=Haliotis rufescens TaxID=6454 RepID=UPI001EB09CD1|nr:nicotinamidase-like [Haliotis rufescens]